jgi:hypothetical protein
VKLEWIKSWKTGFLMEMACAEHTLALENAPIGPVPGSLGLEDGKDVEKSTRIWVGEVSLLKSRKFRVWIGSRLNPYGISRLK